MGSTPVSELVQTYGDLVDRHFTYGPNRSRLLVRVVRTLAAGAPVANEQVASFAAELGIPPDDADAFLRTVTERDAEDRIVGAVPGLSLNEYPHRFEVNGIRLSTWCAADTLGLPAVLDQTASVESPSPVSGQPIRLRISPRGVEDVEPAGAVISVVVVDPKAVDLPSVEAIVGTFCHHIFFFTSRDEAERWAADRSDIAILSLDEGYEITRLFVSALLDAPA